MFDLTGIEGFIFDCDGTLLDSLKRWKDVEAPLFAAAGPMSVEEEDRIHGAPIEEAARIFHDDYGVMDSADAVLAHLDGGLIPFYRDQVEPLPGAVEFVRYVKMQSIPAVVLSSSPLRYIELGLIHAGIEDCFVDIITTEGTGLAKQDPRIYDHAARFLGFPIETLWAVDDAYYALKAMKEAGLSTIAVGAQPVKNGNDLREVSDEYVASLSDLL